MKAVTDLSVDEQVQKIQSFLEGQFHAELLERIRKGTHKLTVDFDDLARFDPEIATLLLEDPENMLRACEAAVDRLEGVKDFTVRFRNLPESQHIPVRNLRAHHLGKLVQLTGIVRQKTDVRPQVTSARFECPSCGNSLLVLQTDVKFREPDRCGCGRKGRFRMLSKELVDAQKIVLEEAPDELEGGEQPKRLNIFLKKDLVAPITESRTNPGSKVRVTGYLKEVPITLATGGQSTRFDLMLDTNHIEAVQEDYSQIKITPEEEEEIFTLAKDPQVYEKLLKSLAPSIYGHERIKEAMILQMLGGVKKTRTDGIKTRGDMHILLVGDPGSGKCLRGDSLIALGDGSIQPIEEVFSTATLTSEGSTSYQSETPIPLTVLNEQGSISNQEVSRLWKRKVDKLLHVKTASGAELFVTKEHPLFTTWNGFITSVPAEQLRVGDVIAAPRVLRTQGRVQTLSLMNNKKRRNALTVPKVVDEEFAYWCGLLVGDGCVRKTQTSASIGITNEEPILLEQFERLSRRFFGAKVHTYTKHATPALRKEMYSLGLYEWLKQNTPELCFTSEKKHIPRKILQSKKAVLCAFLAGLYDTDGHCNKTKRTIELTTKSQLLAQELKIALLRLGIVARLQKRKKFASNTKAKILRTYYSVYVSGADAETFLRQVPLKTDKGLALPKTTTNTNVDVIPGLSSLLRTLRQAHGLTQSSFDIARSTYQHYERGDRNPSRHHAQTISQAYSKSEHPLSEILHQIAHADVFWDPIISITEHHGTEWVYDFEVANVHNFVAQGCVVHNSQLLKRGQQVAPKSRFVSGKGASGAGLCVGPKSVLCTNPGGLDTIERVVETRMPTTQEEFRPGVWKREHISDIKVQSMQENLSVQGQHPAALWRLAAPEYMHKITSSSGKSIEITKNTQLFVLRDGDPQWIKSGDVRKGDWIATPRKLIGGENTSLKIADLFSANPVVHGVETIVQQACKKLTKKYGTLREAARVLGINENHLYHHWVHPDRRGTITLAAFKKVCEEAGISWHKHVQRVSLYNGKQHNIPVVLSKDMCYVLGMLLGDGDLQKTLNSFSVRLSSSEPTLINTYTQVLSDEWGLSCDVRPATSARPQAARTSSVILGETLLSLGMACSPKSHRIQFSEHVLHLDNSLLSHVLAGLFDTDGWVHLRSGKGSSQIGLSSVSEDLIRQVQLVLLRFGIHSRIRSRPPTKERITGKYTRFVLEITSTQDIALFAEHIALRHPKKRATINSLIAKNACTRRERLPHVGHRLKPLLQKAGISLKKAGWHPSIARAGLQRLLANTGSFPQKEFFVKLAHSDVLWEEVIENTCIPSEYDFVYDLTVSDAHNFVVDGILVHNTASVVKDEFMRGWALEAGALVLANKGQIFIDELDKMSHEDRSAFHEALEQQQVTISKANIQATLRCETIVLAAANPKLGRFDPYEMLAKQIDLPSTLINRFDLIFPVRDLPSEEKDRKLANFVLNIHRTGDIRDVPIETDLLKKYISYSRSRIYPELTEDAVKEIENFYVQMRNSVSREGEGISAIPISARQLEGLVRLSEASARTRLGAQVTRDDAKRAIDLLMHCLSQLGVDPDTGKFDIDRLTTGVTASTRNQAHVLKQIIRELAEMTGDPLVSEEEILSKASEQGIKEDKAEEILEKLNRMGDIFRPKPGFYSMMK